MSGHLGKPPQEWEMLRQAPTTVERVSTVAKEAREYRTYTKLPLDPIAQGEHNKYIHTVGADVLKLQHVAKKDVDAAKRRKLAAGKIMRKAVKVSDMDDGGVSITLDLEWDTSTWGNDEIEAGCEALLTVFHKQLTTERRAQAVRMLLKLMERHKVAVTYFRLNIQSIMYKSVAKRLKGGTTTALLELLYVVQACLSRFSYEISSHSFISLFFEMLLIESRMAAQLIQHVFRVHRERQEDKIRSFGSLSEGFGTRAEIMRARTRAHNIRSAELRGNWKLMHCFQTREMRRSIYGLRGPVHVRDHYLLTGLEIIEYLVSSKGGSKQQSNREDVVSSRAIHLLSTFVAQLKSNFCCVALQILVHVSMAPECLLPMIECQIVKTVLRFMQQFRKRNEKRLLVIECVRLLSRLALHSGGLEQVRRGHYAGHMQFEEECESYSFNYLHLFQDVGAEVTSDVVLKTLGSPAVINELADIVINSDDIALLTVTIDCLLKLCTSICFMSVLSRLLESSGKMLQRVIDFLEYEHGEELVLADTALALVLQLCTYEAARGGMVSTNIVTMLQPLVESAGLYHRLSYQKAIFVLVALCRDGEWKSYAPHLILKEVSDHKQIIFMIYSDMMRTIKQPQGSFDISDMVVMDSNADHILRLSQAAENHGVRYICDFFACPDDEHHYSKLPWELACAGCVAMAALTTHLPCAIKVLSMPTVRYLGQCLHLGFIEISKKILNEKKTNLVLNGVAAAVDGLAKLCEGGKVQTTKARHVVRGIADSHAITAANYFLMSLVNNSFVNMSDKYKQLQEDVALDAVRFLERYACCMLAVGGDMTPLQDLSSAVGMSTTQVTQTLIIVYGRTPKMHRVLDTMCQLLCKLTIPPAGATAAISRWKLIEVLRHHMPPPVYSPGQLNEESSMYKLGLRSLPASYIETLVSLCKTDQVKGQLLVDGFLRRVLDKLLLLSSELETEVEMEALQRSIRENNRKIIPNPARYEVGCCLHLIAMCANFSHPKYGCANDLILHPSYRVIEVCCSIIRIQACPRDDRTYCNSLKVLRQLSKDSSRVHDLFRDLHVMPLIHKEMLRAGELSMESTADCVDLVFHVAMGLRGKHLRSELPKMHDALTKASRVFLRLSQAAADAMFAITKYHGSESNQTEEGPVEMSELQQLLHMTAEDDDYEAAALYGTYEACGTTTCGSLRHRDTPSSHGAYAKAETDEKAALELDFTKMARLNDNALELSQESARDPELRAEVQRRKVYYGFAPEDSLPAPSPKKRSTRTSSSVSPSRTPGSSRQGRRGSKKKEEPSMSKTASYSIWKSSTPPLPSIRAIDVNDFPELLATRPPPRK